MRRGPADAARPVDAGGHGGAQPAHDSGSIGGTQPVPDAGPIGDARPAPDAGPPCAPAVLGYACITAQGEPLPYEIDAPLEGELTAIGTPEADHCDLTVWGQGSGEFVTFQITEASGRILDVKIDAGGLDAYLDAHPLVVGEPVHIDGVRVGYDIQGEATGFRWLRDGRLAAAVLNRGRVTGLTVSPLAEVGEPTTGDCCVIHQFGARIGVEGAGVEVDVAPGCAVEAGGLTISNLSYEEYDDLGCCNALGGPYVTVVARP